jgi:S-formylglutathione hydrolase FrmB
MEDMMRVRFLFIILAVLALSVLFLAGCTDKTKDNPTRPMTPEKGLAWLNPFRFYSIVFSTSMDPGYMVSKMYTPPGYDYSGGGGQPYPVLYMLSPFRGDELYYFEHGLAEVADRLLAEGKIQPMIIVCVDGRSQLGGSFYTDSPQQGKYFSAMVTDETFNVDLLVDPRGEFTGTGVPYRGPWTLFSNCNLTRIDELYNTIPDASSRAVCGVGMGGYGAYALAVQTDLFSSVSAVNAPLDFDGSGNNGFLSLIRDVIPAQ